MTHALGEGRTVAAALLLVLLAACAKTDRSQSDTASGNVARSLASTPSQTRQLSGALTKPIEQYTGDELQALVAGLTYTRFAERERRCRAGTGCTRKSSRTRLRVAAVTDADSLSPTTLPRYGVIAARATNRGAAPDEMYGMRPGARFEYYLVVMPARDSVGGSARWELWELDALGETRTSRRVNGGRFVGCNHAFVRGARADFKTCAEATDVRPASLGALLQGGEPPLWIGCAVGCCVNETGNPG